MTVFTIEQPDLESSTESYARRFAGSLGDYFLEVQRNIVHSMMPSPPCRVLDVGGGHAQLAPSLISAGYDTTIFGSDGTCTHRLDAEVGKGNYRLVLGNLLSLPFEKDSFDVVLAFRLLPHLAAWERFVGEISRVASECVIVDYPTLRSFNWFSNRLFSMKQRIEENTRKYRCFRDDQLRRVFRDNAFYAEEESRQFLLPMALHRLVRLAPFSRFVEGVAMQLGLSRVFGSPVVLKATNENSRELKSQHTTTRTEPESVGLLSKR